MTTAHLATTHTVVAVVAALLIAAPAVAQITNDPFREPIPASEGMIVVRLEEFAVLPDVDGAPARPMVLVDEPGSGRLFVNDMWGLIGGLYVPPLPYNHDNDFINNVGCMGGVNIPYPPIADPSTGMMYASHQRTCGAPGFMRPMGGVDEEYTEYAVPDEGGATPNYTPTTGTTVAAWLPGGGTGEGRLSSIEGLRLFKPLDNELSAFQMNTCERMWSLPVGQTPDLIRNHPLLAGVDVPNTGGIGLSIQMVTGDLLVQTRALSRGGVQFLPDAPLELHARDKRTGEILGSIDLPAPGQYGMMTYMHECEQYIVVQIGSFRTDFPGALVAYALP